MAARKNKNIFPCVKEGCEAVFGAQKDFEEHLKKCPFPKVACPSCKQEVPWNFLEKHLGEVCEHRFVKCAECHAYHAYVEKELHLKNCPERSRNHPFGEEGHAFRGMEGHLEPRALCPGSEEGNEQAEENNAPKKQIKVSGGHLRIVGRTIQNLKEKFVKMDSEFQHLRLMLEEEQDDDTKENTMLTATIASQFESELRKSLLDQQKFNKEVVAQLDLLKEQASMISPRRRAVKDETHDRRRNPRKKKEEIAYSFDAQGEEEVDVENVGVDQLIKELTRQLDTDYGHNLTLILPSICVGLCKESFFKAARDEGTATINGYAYNFKIAAEPGDSIRLCLQLSPADGPLFSLDWAGLACLMDDGTSVIRYRGFRIKLDCSSKTIKFVANINFTYSSDASKPMYVGLAFLLFRSSAWETKGTDEPRSE